MLALQQKSKGESVPDRAHRVQSKSLQGKEVVKLKDAYNIGENS
jgi:hypothetical protein